MDIQVLSDEGGFGHIFRLNRSLPEGESSTLSGRKWSPGGGKAASLLVMHVFIMIKIANVQDIENPVARCKVPFHERREKKAYLGKVPLRPCPNSSSI